MSDSLRITDHPVLGPEAPRRTVNIYFEGREITAYEGEPIAAALTSAGIRAFRTTEIRHEHRGIYCAQGRCSDCMMIVDGQPNTRTCVTPVREGMRIEVQHGLA